MSKAVGTWGSRFRRVPQGSNLPGRRDETGLVQRQDGIYVDLSLEDPRAAYQKETSFLLSLAISFPQRQLVMFEIAVIYLPNSEQFYLSKPPAQITWVLARRCETRRWWRCVGRWVQPAPGPPRLGLGRCSFWGGWGGGCKQQWEAGLVAWRSFRSVTRQELVSRVKLTRPPPVWSARQPLPHLQDI